MARRGLERPLGTVRAIGIIAGLDQGTLDRLPIRDITNGTRHEHARRSLQRAEANLDGKLGTVPGKAIELEPRSHGSRLRVLEKAAPVLGMHGSETLGKQRLYRLLGELRGFVSERLVDQSVRKYDDAACVDDYRRIGGSVEQFCRQFAREVHDRPLLL